jgi:hypothetical protein
MGRTPPFLGGQVSAELDFPHTRFGKKELTMKLVRVEFELAKA